MGCLLKFQSWIGVNEAVVRSDHESIVQWYKEYLCTISGRLRPRSRWHEFLRLYTPLIEYIPGDHNADGDTLSRSAYPAGVAQDTNFIGPDEDASGWTQLERQEKAEQGNVLRPKYPYAFACGTARTNIDGVVAMVTLGDHEEQLRTLHACYQNSSSAVPGRCARAFCNARCYGHQQVF